MKEVVKMGYAAAVGWSATETFIIASNVIEISYNEPRQREREDAKEERFSQSLV